LFKTNPLACMSADAIRIRGARQHNLKNIELAIPKNCLVVITGVSGSGKSSLAFDTLHAEGQRRYVESLSLEARAFLGQLQKPEVDYIEGLAPSIAIGQRLATPSPRAIVATATDIYDFLRILFAEFGVPHDPRTGRVLKRYTASEIVDRILQEPRDTPVQILAPVVRGEKGGFRDVLDRLRREGFLRARLDGQWVFLEELRSLPRGLEHTLEVLVDRLRVCPSSRARLADSVELALRLGGGQVRVIFGGEAGGGSEWLASVLPYDPESGFSFAEITPRHFSFNSPLGACPACHGLGMELGVDPDSILSDPAAPLSELPFAPLKRLPKSMRAAYGQAIHEVALRYGEPLHRPWKDCSPEFQRAVLFGDHAGSPESGDRGSSWEGLLAALRRLSREARSRLVQRKLAGFLSPEPCGQCGGSRLKEEVRAVRIESVGFPPMGIHQVVRLTVEKALQWVEGISIEKSASKKLCQELGAALSHRLRLLEEIGLGYLTLDRELSTLSGGELQRVRIASGLGSRLSGVIYVLDEPSIGLHPRDHHRLLSVLRRLRDLGNTVIVVEHDLETIRASDYIVELGPLAGNAGGQVVAHGTPEELSRRPGSLTGALLRGELGIAVPEKRREPKGWLRIVGARENNLKNLTVAFPLGVFSCVTGVSGSGKSTLVHDILGRALFRHFYKSRERPGKHDYIEGVEELDKVILVDPSSIGRNPRSNALTYCGILDPIRELFAGVPAARVRGYGPGRFSFNVPGGRCERCHGEGTVRMEMNLLPAMEVVCDHCQGKRFNRETLEITYKGKNIADVLELTVEEALQFFRNVPVIREKLSVLVEVGLGYLRLGQPASTLSGGEAQRLKLASELGKRTTGRTLYLMDEPTTGLHLADIQKLLELIARLRDLGNTVIVIEHNLEVIKCADYLIDLGPEAGERGGELVAQGTPEEVARNPKSITGQWLRSVLSGGIP
jgi:excinuclease ABC subunit A